MGWPSTVNVKDGRFGNHLNIEEEAASTLTLDVILNKVANEWSIAGKANFLHGPLKESTVITKQVIKKCGHHQQGTHFAAEVAGDAVEEQTLRSMWLN
jgi:hypothetical protein